MLKILKKGKNFKSKSLNEITKFECLFCGCKFKTDRYKVHSRLLAYVSKCPYCGRQVVG